MRLFGKNAPVRSGLVERCDLFSVSLAATSGPILVRRLGGFGRIGLGRRRRRRVRLAVCGLVLGRHASLVGVTHAGQVELVSKLRP